VRQYPSSEQGKAELDVTVWGKLTNVSPGDIVHIELKCKEFQIIMFNGNNDAFGQPIPAILV
jgi:hypothetical protein